MEDQPLHRSRRLQNLPSLTMDPPPPLRRKIINISGSFESIGISESPEELNLDILSLIFVQ